MHMNPKPEQALSSIQVVNSNSHEAVNNIWHMWLYHSMPSGSSILFKRLPFNGTPEGRSALLHLHKWHMHAILPQQGLVRLLRPGGQEPLDPLAIARQNPFLISGHECAPAWLPPLYREQIRQAATQEGSAECLPWLFMQWPSPFCGQFSAKLPDHR